MIQTTLISLLIGSTLACGGFFCSRQQPVVQDGENILFSMNGDQVTATIQIKYQGEAEDFSWVLPLPSTPDALGTSSDILFSALHRFTDPQFQMDIKYPENCKTLESTPCPFLERASFGSAAGVPQNEDSGVVVEAAGEVGPFTYIVISAKPGDVDGTALFEWLNDNGFDQPEQAKPIIKRYVMNRHRFVTLKLQKGRSAGELVPIVLQYKSPSTSEMSCVPLRLTAIAANDNMPVFVWVAGKTRAVPTNYVHITPDLRALPWTKCALSGGSFFGGPVFQFNPFGGVGQCTKEYQDLLKDSAESYGIDRWMTTEYAGEKPRGLLDAIWNKNQLAFSVAEMKKVTGPAAFLRDLLNRLRPLNLQQQPQTQDLLRRILPKPADVSKECSEDRAFYSPNNNQCVGKYVTEFDADKASDMVQTELIDPIIAAREELEKFPYITRLYSSISPEHMDRDPIFRFIPSSASSELGDVSNIHKTTLEVQCPSEPGPTTADLIYADGTKKTIEQVNLRACGGITIGEPPVEPEPPIIAFAPAAALLRSTGSDGELNVEVLADKEEAQTLDETLKDDVVGVDFTDTDMCNAGSKGCRCMGVDKCATGLVCQREGLVTKCSISDTDDITISTSGTALSMSLAAAVIALVAHQF